jgi:hypothetical protein
VPIFTVGEHGQSPEILKGILRHIKMQRFKKCGLGRARFVALGKSDQASVRWRIGNIVHAFIVASVLSELDVVRIEVEEQKVLEGLRVAKKNTGTCVDLGLGGSGRARRLDVHTIAEATEARQIWFTNTTKVRAESKLVRSLHLITVNGHVVESEETIKRGTREQGTDRISNVSMGTLDGLILMGRIRSRTCWQRPSSPPRYIRT